MGVAVALLLFPLAELPVMAKGKGNKLMALEPGERVMALVTLGDGQALTVLAGQRTLTLKPADLTHYHGKRAQRGHLLPRGFQKATALTAKPLDAVAGAALT